MSISLDILTSNIQLLSYVEVKLPSLLKMLVLNISLSAVNVFFNSKIIFFAKKDKILSCYLAWCRPSETWSKIMVSLIMFVVLCVKSLWWNICTCQKTASHVSAQLQRWFSLVGSFSLGFAEVPNDTHDENVTVSVWKGVPKPQFKHLVKYRLFLFHFKGKKSDWRTLLTDYFVKISSHVICFTVIILVLWHLSK